MADAFGTAAPAARKPYPWIEIFRVFQVALDPRKLGIAAGGILAMSLGWYMLSLIFWHDGPVPFRPDIEAAVKADSDFKDKNPSEISAEVSKRYSAGMEKATKKYIEDVRKEKAFKDKAEDDKDVIAEANKRLESDAMKHMAFRTLAGPGGKIRSMPWYETRGDNPYVFLMGVSYLPSSEWIGATWDYLKKQLPVMAEPLTKLLLPLVKFTDPFATTMSRIYLLLVLLWTVLVWAFAGGVITRIAAVQLSGKDRVSIGQAVSYVCKRYISYALSPIVPVAVVAAIVVGLCLLGVVCLFPWLGDFIWGFLGIPLVILGGIMMTVLVIGLVGYPLMTSTLSAEGSDTFDALSRSYNYVFQSPWTYAWNWIVAIVYGTIVTFFVVFVASLMVYLGKWAISQTPFVKNSYNDYLFMYAPESFGWKELLLDGGPLEGRTNDKTGQYVYKDEKLAKEYKDKFWWSNWVGAGLSTAWLLLVFLLMLGFSYSFFWSAATMIYLLMRQKVDDVETDEVYLDDEEPIVPPPSTSTMAPSGPAPATLPMVAPDPAPVPPPPAPPTTEAPPKPPETPPAS